MAVSADALTTLTNARLALGIPTADTGNDTLIEDMIDAATEWIQQECNRKFRRRNYNRAADAAGAAHGTTSALSEPYYHFDGDGRSYSHVLPNFPVDKGGTFVLEELQSRASDGTETWTSTGYAKDYDYIVEWDRGIVRLLGKPFNSGKRNYRVTYEAGYEEPEPGTAAAPYVPYDLERCCIEMVRDMFQGDKHRVSAETIGSWSRSYDLSKPNPMIDNALRKYRAVSNLIL